MSSRRVLRAAAATGSRCCAQVLAEQDRLDVPVNLESRLMGGALCRNRSV